MPVAADIFRLAFEAAPVGMMTVDDSGKITFANAQIERMFGCSREALIGSTLERFVPGMPRGPQSHRQALAAPTSDTESDGELLALRQDGTEFPVQIGRTALAGEKLTLISLLDVSEHQRSVRQLNQRATELADHLKERDVLLREVHHRVKNNLQVISSIINIQVRKLQAGVSRDVLLECKTRFEAVALIHEKLCQSRDVAQVQFSDYISSLADNVLHAADAAAAGISLSIDAEVVSLGMNKLIPCGLILNELLTNAVKHAFPEDRGGTIHVTLERNGPDRVRLTVSDNGVGMQQTGDTEIASSMGLELVSTLSQQLDGQMQILDRDGTAVTVEFPADS